MKMLQTQGGERGIMEIAPTPDVRIPHHFPAFPLDAVSSLLLASTNEARRARPTSQHPNSNLLSPWNYRKSVESSNS